MLRRNVQQNDPDSLTNELVTARAAYNDTVQSVITRATERRGVIGDTINDLKVEDDKLAQVVASANGPSL
jgi:hypothetical protein